MSREITHAQKLSEFNFWRKHEQNLIKNKLASEEGLRWLSICTQLDTIGFGQGMTRPGELGKFDLYYFLIQDAGIDKAEALLIADLPASALALEELREEMREDSFDIDDAADVREFNRRKSMTPEQCTEEINRLEVLLANSES